MRGATVLLAAMAMGQAINAQAQGAEPGQGAWRQMREAVFDQARLPSTAPEEDRAMAQRIWGTELAARRSDQWGPLPGFVLIGDVREGSKRIVFSMYAAAESEHCDPAANGAGAKDIFVECRMRVTHWPYTGRHMAELPGYCMIYAASETNSRVEYRYESAAQTVQFRTIQFGKVVPQCSRALKLG